MGERTSHTASVRAWIERPLRVLLRTYGVEEAFLFGSWARADADALSDIDLVIVAPSTRPFVERFRDYPQIWKTAPAAIDLLIYTPEEFRRQRRENRFLRHVLKYARKLT